MANRPLPPAPVPARRRPRGRPQKVVDVHVVERLALRFATRSEIAATVGCSVDTLDRRFADVIKSGHLRAAISLRRRQFELAMEGNVGMLIWLGKCYLDQHDRLEHGGADGGAIEHTVRVIYETAPVVTYETRAVASTPGPALPPGDAA